MKNISRRKFTEMYKELAKLYDEQEMCIEYLEKERDKWRKKYYKEVDNTNRLSSTISFCIENMKNEFECTDQRTKQELHEMVKTLEELLIEKPKQPEGNDAE